MKLLSESLGRCVPEFVELAPQMFRAIFHGVVQCSRRPVGDATLRYSSKSKSKTEVKRADVLARLAVGIISVIETDGTDR